MTINHEWLEWRDNAIIAQAKEIKMLRDAISTIKERFCRPEDQALLMDDGMPLSLFISAALGEIK